MLKEEIGDEETEHFTREIPYLAAEGMAIKCGAMIRLDQRHKAKWLGDCSHFYRLSITEAERDWAKNENNKIANL